MDKYLNLNLLKSVSLKQANAMQDVSECSFVVFFVLVELAVAGAHVDHAAALLHCVKVFAECAAVAEAGHLFA